MKVATIVGARPQFIKAAVVSRAIIEYNRSASHGSHLKEVIIHTGQHYDDNMSDIFFRELNIPEPDYNLDIHGISHGAMTGQMMEKIEEVLLEEKPAVVLVYGDTNSTLAGALAAAKIQIPVAHIEAGLRSFNRSMPEEINRVLTDHLSSLLFCPTDTAINNLKNEGIATEVYNVGDVMFDAFLFNKELCAQKSRILSDLELQPKAYHLATVHRQENTEDPKRLLTLFNAFSEIASADCPFVIPLHPRTTRALEKQSANIISNSHLRVIPPVSYLDMIVLEAYARTIFTDSGGVQKEAYFAQTPCITLRDETEWVETVESGMNILTGADELKIIQGFQKMLRQSPKIRPQLFGDGTAGYKIVEKLCLHIQG